MHAPYFDNWVKMRIMLKDVSVFSMILQKSFKYLNIIDSWVSLSQVKIVLYFVKFR